MGLVLWLLFTMGEVVACILDTFGVVDIVFLLMIVRTSASLDLKQLPATSIRCSLGRWPGQSMKEMPDCGVFNCHFADGQENFFAAEQARIVTIYEVS